MFISIRREKPTDGLLELKAFQLDGVIIVECGDYGNRNIEFRTGLREKRKDRQQLMSFIEYINTLVPEKES